MQLKNYQEDVVMHVIDVALENSPEFRSDITFVNDVAAYVLNRVPPKYIMSERGFTRFVSLHFLNDENGIDSGLVNLLELMTIINRGIEVVKERRKTVIPSSLYSYFGTTVPDIKNIEYMHNFPQFIGRVKDRDSKKPVNNACVTMFIDGLKAHPAEPGWINPYYTNELTRGAYSFWPQAIKNTAKSKRSKITITIDHEDYEPVNLVREISTDGVFRVYNYIHGTSIINLETSFLIPRM